MRAARWNGLWATVALAAVLSQLAAQEPAKKVKKADKGKAEPQVLDPFDRPEESIVDQNARFYLWYDKQGWHLRTTSKMGRIFRGTIKVKDARIASCRSIGLKEKQKNVKDAWQVNAARSELKFEFQTGKLSDGFDMVVEGEEGEIEFELLIDMAKNPKTVFVGRGLQHPDENPFKLPATPKRSVPGTAK